VAYYLSISRAEDSDYSGGNWAATQSAWANAGYVLIDAGADPEDCQVFVASSGLQSLLAVQTGQNNTGTA
jgi:hypothetical protein